MKLSKSYNMNIKKIFQVENNYVRNQMTILNEQNAHIIRMNGVVLFDNLFWVKANEKNEIRDTENNTMHDKYTHEYGTQPGERLAGRK